MVSGMIGNITRKVIKQTLNDEVQFFIPVTNNSSEEACYFLKLRDDAGKLISFAPVPTTEKNKIAAGATETMVISTEGQIVHINDIDDSTVKFELLADNVQLLGLCAVTWQDGVWPYEIVDTKEYYIPKYYGDIAEATMWKILIVVLIVGAAYVFAKSHRVI